MPLRGYSRRPRLIEVARGSPEFWNSPRGLPRVRRRATIDPHFLMESTAGTGVSTHLNLKAKCMLKLTEIGFVLPKPPGSNHKLNI
jgi:hypothetical protein